MLFKQRVPVVVVGCDAETLIETVPKRIRAKIVDDAGTNLRINAPQTGDPNHKRYQKWVDENNLQNIVVVGKY